MISFDEMTLPSRMITPLVIGSKPAIALSTVVLPQPLSPTTPTRSPGATVKDTSRVMAVSPPG